MTKNHSPAFLLRAIALSLSTTFTLASSAVAQMPAPMPASGRIVGRVVDAHSGEGLSAVTIQIVGTPLSAISAVDGRFSIGNVPAGKATIRALSIGYAAKTITEVNVPASAAVEQNISLETDAIAISALEVTAAAEKGSVNRALDQQRTSTAIVNSVTAEQISKSPDGDAAQAVQRISGVTVQDNKFVVVRGLGERYTTTSLNGTRIPSPEPEKKIVPLDLFPSSLLESVTTSKTFTPDQSGDFSGAQVDIKMREFPTRRTRIFTSSFGLNDKVTGRTLIAAPTTGGEWLGFSSGQRALPAGFAAAGRFENKSQLQMNSFASAFRNTWSPVTTTGRPTGSLGVSMGGNEPVLGHQIGYVFSGTYSHGQEVRENQVRALAQPSSKIQGGTEEVDRFTGNTGRTSVLWGGVLNASTLVGSHSRLALSGTYNRSADNEARQEAGFSEQFSLPLAVTRLSYIERSVASTQLVGEHELGSRSRINWAVTGSHVSRSEPDRSEFVYSTPSDPVTGAPLPQEWFASAAEGAVRTFADLKETLFEGKADYKLAIGAARNSFMKFGVQARGTNRGANTFAYSMTAPTLPIAYRRLSAEQIFDGRFAGNNQSYFQVKPLAQGGSYTAADHLLSGYGMLEFALRPAIRTVVGARIEKSSVSVEAESPLGEASSSKPRYTDVLPSLAFNIALSETQSLRLSASQTLSRPEYREIAEVQYRDVIGAENIRGNPDLKRALIKNFDARWEMYPTNGEVLSVALFAKVFKDPIEQVFIGNSASSKIVTFLNAKAARNYGVEFEARKRMAFLGDRFEGLSGFLNATLMKSEIEIGDASVGASKVNDKRAMVGQSPYVVNAGLTYNSASAATSVTALYNVFGKRISSAAVAPLPDAYEQARNQVDVSVRFPFLRGLAAKVDVKNVLDSPFEIRQGTVVREFYRGGRIVSMGINWRP